MGTGWASRGSPRRRSLHRHRRWNAVEERIDADSRHCFPRQEYRKSRVEARARKPMPVRSFRSHLLSYPPASRRIFNFALSSVVVSPFARVQLRQEVTLEPPSRPYSQSYPHLIATLHYEHFCHMPNEDNIIAVCVPQCCRCYRVSCSFFSFYLV